MSDAIRNATWQELDALAAHDQQLARDAGRARIEAIVHWRIAHGDEAFDVANDLQDLADLIVTMRGAA